MSMEDMKLVLAANLRCIREERKLSLDKVSEMTGVSKSMLGQIERGESNPTLQTVWKIANGLRVSLVDLTESPRSDTVIISKKHISPIVGDNGLFRVYPVFPFDGETRSEILSIELDKGAYSSSEPHNPRTVEYVLVFEGELTVTVGTEEHSLKAGESIKFRSDRPHSYHNSGNGITRLCVIMFYPE